uniref:Guanylate cyclase n=1 Tax=Rhabditophanes sp. KR3021 TaxID=114890 RepID=A0AC35UGM0_9BILA
MYYNNGVKTFFGPTCSVDLSIGARFTNSNHLLQFNFFNEFKNEAFDASIVQMSTESATNIAGNLYTVLSMLNWKKICIIYCQECMGRYGSSDELLQTIQNVLLTNYIDVRITVQIVKSDYTVDGLQPYLDKVKKNARIVVPLLGRTTNDYLIYMQAIQKAGMNTTAYMNIIFNLLTYPSVPNAWMLNNVLDQKTMLLFDRTIVLTNNYYTDDTIKLFIKDFSIEYTDTRLFLYIQLYESVYTYLTMIKKGSIFANSVTTAVKEKYLKLFMRNNILNGPYGLIYLDNTNQRNAAFKVEVVDATSQSLQPFINISMDSACVVNDVTGNSDCNALKGAILNKDAAILQSLPMDMPSCGYQDELCDQTGTIIIIGSVIASVCIVTAVFVVIRKIRTGETESMPWAIQAETITVFSNGEYWRGESTFSSHFVNGAAPKPPVIVQAKELLKNRLVGSLDKIGTILIDPYVLKEKMVFDKQDMDILYNLRQTFQENLHPFIGVCIYNPRELYIIWSKAKRGNLENFLFQSGGNTSSQGIPLEELINSYVRDLLKALDYIHSSVLHYHGGLTPANCWIDSHWILKVGGCCMSRMLFKWKNMGLIGNVNDGPIISNSELHYYAPELRKAIINSMHHNRGERLEFSTQEGRAQDMYSFGIILYEMLFKKKAVQTDDSSEMNSEEDAQILNPKFEAMVPNLMNFPVNHSVHSDLISLMNKCVSEKLENRPDPNMARKITDATLKMPTSLVDHMMKKLESHALSLEETVADRLKELEEEQKRADTLLSEMIPKSIADDIKNGKPPEAMHYENTTIMYSDIVGFTSLCSKLEPMEVVNLLDGLAMNFDRIITDNGCYKIETIGDAYVVAAGIPILSQINHIKCIANMTLQMRDFLDIYRVPGSQEKLRCRFGFHTGSSFSGVVGMKSPRFCVFGKTAQFASKMEQTGIPEQIQLSLQAQQLLAKHFPEFICEPRGGVRIDIIGTMLTYFLLRKDNSKKIMSTIPWADDSDNIQIS